MLVLVDTNCLLRLVEPRHSQHAIAAQAIDALRRLRHHSVLVPQIIYEFWAVATRPVAANGLELSAAGVESKLDTLMPSFRLLRDERAILEIWQQLVIDHDVKGKQIHDARLVAAMLRHGISHLLTFNAADFTRYTEITVVEPHSAHALGPIR